MRAVYHPAFKISLDAGWRRYEAIGLPLAERFRDEVRDGVRQLLSGLVDHAVGPHGFRCYRCKKFPYLIYHERTTDAVMFLAVVYAGQDPGSLQETLNQYRGSS